jgi:hypothetical protein
MIPHDQPEREKMINRMLNVCADNEEKLSSWELDFTHSVDNQFHDKGTLTDRQCEILEKIYDRIS